jgi:hypothetical protein
MILNIVRNLLLAIPPQISELDFSTIAEASKLRELQRASENSSSGALDIKSKAAREELKSLIEDFMKSSFNASADHIVEEELNMARFVEVVVGSGTWILRTSGTSELLEMNFTGVYATFTYHEDKFVH